MMHLLVFALIPVGSVLPVNIADMHQRFAVLVVPFGIVMSRDVGKPAAGHAVTQSFGSTGQLTRHAARGNPRVPPHS